MKSNLDRKPLVRLGERYVYPFPPPVRDRRVEFRRAKRVGPNALCDCGSGVKHKKCCGSLLERRGSPGALGQATSGPDKFAPDEAKAETPTTA